MAFMLCMESKLYVLSVVMLNVVMLSVVMLSVVMLSVVIPNVVALFVGGNANCFEWAWFRKKSKISQFSKFRFQIILSNRFIKTFFCLTHSNILLSLFQKLRLYLHARFGVHFRRICAKTGE
jgi:hypothetical protein